MSSLALKGPYWVTVRQHRKALWWTLGLAAVAVVALVTSRLWSDSAVAALRAAGCTVSSENPTCFQPTRDYLDDQWNARHIVEYAAMGMLVLPGIVGAFVAGPMLARELESGTYKLAWTQSVTPTRWLAAKLAVPAALVLAGLPLLSLAFYWAWRTGPAHDYPTYWYEPNVFVSYGIVPVAHTLLGLALGAAVGLLVRRTVVAMSVTALITGAALAVLAWLRAGLWPVKTITGSSVDVSASADWRLDHGMVTATGERIRWGDCVVTPDVDARQCMTARGGVAEFMDVHPASHFWPLQLVETGICLAVAALAILLAFRVLRRRHG
ncbi:MULTISPECIES: hypothetical protein [Streptomyces]|uniref:ABC transporter permease n=1 Tax=Streptomyces solicathayae TaxID=3081768 RepID=A0ABZ0LXL2_9ACTN|nr:hypothetical protein [Streptomyces sp. HUAS YS2]WOX23519.1 hypothetical protein R2D22_19890 [Streptomyces sp. HUAS YS2]